MVETEPDKTISELLGDLTLKERRFCDAWLRNGGIGTQAILQAGYDTDKHNASSIRWPAMSIVSPSIMRAGPVMSAWAGTATMAAKMAIMKTRRMGQG